MYERSDLTEAHAEECEVDFVSTPCDFLVYLTDLSLDWKEDSGRVRGERTKKDRERREERIRSEG